MNRITQIAVILESLINGASFFLTHRLNNFDLKSANFDKFWPEYRKIWPYMQISQSFRWLGQIFQFLVKKNLIKTELCYEVTVYCSIGTSNFLHFRVKIDDPCGVSSLTLRRNAQLQWKLVGSTVVQRTKLETRFFFFVLSLQCYPDLSFAACASWCRIRCPHSLVLGQEFWPFVDISKKNLPYWSTNDSIRWIFQGQIPALRLCVHGPPERAAGCCWRGRKRWTVGQRRSSGRSRRSKETPSLRQTGLSRPERNARISGHGLPVSPAQIQHQLQQQRRGGSRQVPLLPSVDSAR